MRVSRIGEPDDLLNSVIGGFGCGTILGRLQGQASNSSASYSLNSFGSILFIFKLVTFLTLVCVCFLNDIAGPTGAARYSFIFAVVGTAIDYTTLKIKPTINQLKERKGDWSKLPEWSPIRVLDEEAVAAKRSREEQIYRKVHNLNKEET